MQAKHLAQASTIKPSGKTCRNKSREFQQTLRCCAEMRVQAVLGVAPEHVHGQMRGRTSVVLARHLIIYLVRSVGGISLKQTAAICGRDRRLAAFAVNRIEAVREQDARFDRLVDLLASQLTYAIARVEVGP